MSNTVERGQLQIARDHTSNPVATVNAPAVADRPGSTLPASSPSPTPEPPDRPKSKLQGWLQIQPWNFLKRLNQTGHNGWLVTILVVILVVAMSLSFGFVRGWLDAKSTLTASAAFFVLLLVAMVIAHWPSRSSR